MLTVENLTFQYPTAETPALTDLTFEVDEGDVLGVLGPVEAGKTTLSMVLAGFVPEITGGWSEGVVDVAGRDPRGGNDGRVAMVFEDYSSQLTQIRLIDEVLAPLTNRGVPVETARQRANALLDTVGLEDVPEEKYTWELSGGQKQRLAIAAALAAEPEVLILDTATDMLDPDGQADVRNLIDELAGEMTLVVTENDPNKLVGLADDILVLDAGSRRALGPAESVLRDRALLADIGVGLPTPLAVAEAVGLSAEPLTQAEFVAAYEDATGSIESAVEQPPRIGADGGTYSGRTDGESSAPTNPVIEATGLEYTYGDGTPALRDVGLTVRPGEVHAILGANGAGKSTLTKLLVGLLNPDAGTITVAGQDTSDTTAKALAEHVGTALQNPDEQLSERTVEMELRRPLKRRQTSKRGPFGLLGRTQRYDDEYIDDRIQQVQSLVGLEESHLAKDPLFLPLGERRVVTMATALGPDPAALVLDEPTAGVDAATSTLIKRAIEELRDAGKAVVLVEHDMDFVCEVADTVTVLDDGRVVEQGPVDEVFAVGRWDALESAAIRPPRPARLAASVGVEALTRADLVEELAARLEGQA